MFQRCSIKKVRSSNRKLSTKVTVRNSNSMGKLDSRARNIEPNNNIKINDNSCINSLRLGCSRSVSVPVDIDNVFARQKLDKVDEESGKVNRPIGGGSKVDTLVLLGKAAGNEKDALATENSSVHCGVNNAKSTCNGDKPDGCSTIPTPLDVTSTLSKSGISRQMPEVHLPSSVSGFSLKSKCTNPFLVDDDNDDEDDNKGEKDEERTEAFSVERSEFTEMESMENDCEQKERRGMRSRTTMNADMQPMLLAGCTPNGLAANGECDKSLLLLNEMEEPISMPVFLRASSASTSNDDGDDNTNGGDDCTTMSVDFLDISDDWMTNANHKSCTSLVQTAHWPHNDLGRASGRSDAKGAKLRMASNYGQRLRQSHRTSSSENVQATQSQQANDFNRPRRVPKYPDRLMNGDFDKYSGYVRRTAETPKTINGIPTLPFQRQDYSRPDEHSDEINEHHRGGVTSITTKPLRKELFNFVSREKSLMPNIKKLNIAYPNKTQAGPSLSLDVDEKIYDKNTFKRSLMKIGHKCGLRISRSPEIKKSENLLNCSSHNIIGLTAKTSRYASHQSAVDLSQNLPYLDHFLQENSDRIQHTKGTQSIGKATTRKRRHGHKRTKSCSKNMGTAQLLEFTNVHVDSSDSGGNVFRDNESGHSNYYAMEAEIENSRHQNDLNHSNFVRQNHISDMQYQKTPSSSDSFGTYNSKKSKQTAKSSRDIPIFGTTEPLLLNSNTTSSSLSSSDYASVYSPSSSFTPEQPFADVYPQHHPPKPIEISPKHRRIKVRPQIDSTYFKNTTEQANAIPDRSCYQFENQLPYHEDYLSHYHNQMVKSAVMASSLPADYPTSSSSNGSYYHLAQRRPSFSGIRGSTAIESGNPIMPPSISSHSSHSAQSYASAGAAHRVIVSQSKKLAGEVVLEYEC